MSGLSIEGDAVERIVKSLLEAKIAEALGGEDRLITKLITQVLEQEIKDSGTRYGGRSNNGTPVTFLQRSIQNAIEACIRGEIMKVVQADSSGVQDRIRELLKEKHANLIDRIARLNMTFSGEYEDKFEIMIKFDKDVDGHDD